MATRVPAAAVELSLCACFWSRGCIGNRKPERKHHHLSPLSLSLYLSISLSLSLYLAKKKPVKTKAPSIIVFIEFKHAFSTKYPICADQDDITRSAPSLVANLTVSWHMDTWRQSSKIWLLIKPPTRLLYHSAGERKRNQRGASFTDFSLSL